MLFPYFSFSVHAMLESEYLQSVKLLQRAALDITKDIQTLPALSLHLEETPAFEPVGLTSSDIATPVTLPSMAFGAIVSLKGCIVPAFLLTWLAFIDSVLTSLPLMCLGTSSLFGIVSPLDLFAHLCEFGSIFLYILDLVQAVGLFCFG
jgi:hypothetical protein